ncbi:uncharacterized protein TNCV_1233851 [Trichonephila clavipes]|nr:uncharacterized protein TNCV_1233851 [Trichonephila clavipes]
MVETPPPKVRSSWYLLIGGIFAFIASLILFISFCSPYWFESYPETYSEFVRMGLWNFCFKNYRHPSYQYDELFDGCHWVFSYKYQNIRDWMQPDFVPEPLMSSLDPTIDKGFRICTELNQAVSKKEQNTSILSGSLDTGVTDNEFVDHLPKKGASIQQTTRKAVPFTSAKNIIKKKMNDLSSIQIY